MLNYNLMIPVEDNQLIKVDLKENKKDTPAERHYKQLCIDELTWCRKNAEIIINKANCLYNLCMGDSNYKGKTRCLILVKCQACLSCGNVLEFVKEAVTDVVFSYLDIIKER